MKISIIIPVYNAEKYIVRCLNSILNQDFCDFEVILVNDSSTDNSAYIIKPFTQQNKHFRLIENSTNLGTMCSREIGYKNATGNYIIFVDSDDELAEDALDTLYSAIVSSDADIVISDYRLLLSRGKSIIKTQKLTHRSDSNFLIKALFSGEVSHCLWGKIYSKKLFEKPLINYKNQCNSEDLILLIQLAARAKKISKIDRITYNYHQNFDSITNTKISENKLRNFGIAWKFLDGFMSQHTDFQHDYESYMIRRLYFCARNNYDIRKIEDVCGAKIIKNFSSIEAIKRHYRFPKYIIIFLTINHFLARKITSLTPRIKQKISKIIWAKP